jgi:TPR repeat protein
METKTTARAFGNCADGAFGKTGNNGREENLRVHERLLAAARRGHLAQYKLAVGSFYGFDRGDPGRDIERALFWLNEAASNNTDPGVKRRAKNMLKFFSLFQKQK